MKTIVLLENSNLLADPPLVAWVMVDGVTGDKFHFAVSLDTMEMRGGCLWVARQLRDKAAEKGWAQPQLSSTYINMVYSFRAWEKRYDALRASFIRRIGYRISMVCRRLRIAGAGWLRGLVRRANGRGE